MLMDLASDFGFGGVELGGARTKGSKNKVPRTQAQLEVLRQRLANARAVKAQNKGLAPVAQAKAKRGRPSKKVVQIAQAVQHLPAPLAVAVVEKELKKKAKAVKKHKDDAILLVNLRSRIANLADRKTGLNYKTPAKFRREVAHGLTSLGYGGVSMGGEGYYSEGDEDMMAGGAMMRHHRKPHHTRGGFDWGKLAETALPLALSFL